MMTIFQNADIYHVLTFCVSVLALGSLLALTVMMLVDSALIALDKQFEPLTEVIERALSVFSNHHDFLSGLYMMRELMFQVPLAAIGILSLFNMKGSDTAHDFTLVAIVALGMYGVCEAIHYIKRKSSVMINHA